MDPEQIYARASGSDRERLLRSRDGGETYEELLQVPDVSAFVVTENELLVGGTRGGGLQRSTDDGAHFERVADWRVSCLAHRGSERFVCGDAMVDGFALARMGPDFETEPLVTFDAVPPMVACMADSTIAQLCPAEVPDLRAHLGFGPPPGSDPTPDAGPDAGSGSSSDGCSTSGKSQAPWLAWITVAFLWRRRQKVARTAALG
jgi:uncharacterized protein (TIGR03382 family)